MSKEAKVGGKKFRRLPTVAALAIKQPLRVAGVTTPRAGETHLVLPGGEIVATFHTCSGILHPTPKAFRRRVTTARLAAHAMAQLLPLWIAAARALDALSGGDYSPKVFDTLQSIEQQLTKAFKVR